MTPIHLAVPEKRCGLTLFLAFFDRCGNCRLPSSATGSGSLQFHRARRVLSFRQVEKKEWGAHRPAKRLRRGRDPSLREAMTALRAVRAVEDAGPYGGGGRRYFSEFRTPNRENLLTSAYILCILCIHSIHEVRP